jgi:transposase
MTSVTVLSGRERRRRWTSSEKLRLVAESLSAGLSVAEFARRHDVHPNMVHSWRRQARMGELSIAPDDEARFVPVAVATESCVALPIESNKRPGSSIDAAVCGTAGRCVGRERSMIPMPAGMRIWVACGTTDMRRGFDGLAMMVQNVLKKSPYCGHMFVFRGKRADRIKILWWDGTGLCLYAKRLERGRFVWPLTREGAAVLTPAQLSMLCEGIDWRVPIRTDAPGEVPACAG